VAAALLAAAAAAPSLLAAALLAAYAEADVLGCASARQAKQQAALKLLRGLYPHVELWGELVESTNSRQREAKVHRDLAKEQARRAARGEDVGSVPGPASAEGAEGSGSAAAEVQLRTERQLVAHDAPRCAGNGNGGGGAAVAHDLLAGLGGAGGVGGERHTPDGPSDAPIVKLGQVTRQMLNVTRDTLWERIATINNRAAGRQVVLLSTEPIPLLDPADRERDPALSTAT
jgi:hypothetical protein